MEQWVARAKELGITNVAFMPVSELTIVPEYRKYCEENLCGNYDRLPACPPKSGTAEDMTAKVRTYRTAIILQIEMDGFDLSNMAEHMVRKKHLNQLTEQLMQEMRESGISDILMMGAGPWKQYSCMSAYCVDAQKMADYVQMTCWGHDGKVRYFSLLLV